MAFQNSNQARMFIESCSFQLTIEEVALGFQDLNDIVDPGPADLRGSGLHLEAHHTSVRVARCQHETAVVTVHAGFHPQAAHLEHITSD